MDMLAPDYGTRERVLLRAHRHDVTLPDDDDICKRIVLAFEGFARACVVPLPPTVRQAGSLMSVLVDDIPAALSAAELCRCILARIPSDTSRAADRQARACVAAGTDPACSGTARGGDGSEYVRRRTLPSRLRVRGGLRG